MERYDYNLLRNLYEIFSPSRGEKKLRKYVRRACIACGAEVYVDKTGNLYATKGEAESYPCVCAHLDQVQHKHSNDFKVYKQDDIIFAYSSKSKEQQGLGADDKNGIWIALELLRELDVLKCAFFVGEEIGCIGSSDADMDFFKDVRYCIQGDRRNGSDLITDISGDICSEEFLNDIDYDMFGYVPTTGLMTDVEQLCSDGVGVSCINFSCGYYHPHTDEECTSWSELCNARDFAYHICTKLTDVYPHKYESKWAKYYGGGYGGYGGTYGSLYGSTYGKWGDYSEDIWDYDKPKTKGDTTAKKDEADEDRDYSAIDEDYDMVEQILKGEPHLTFEEMLHYYGEYLHFADDEEFLKEIYNDVMFGIKNEMM